MEDNNIENVQTETSSVSDLHRVTPLSKYLAMILFVALPFIGGWVGYQYAPEKIVTTEIMNHGSGNQRTTGVSSDSIKDLLGAASFPDSYNVFSRNFAKNGTEYEIIYVQDISTHPQGNGNAFLVASEDTLKTKWIVPLGKPGAYDFNEDLLYIQSGEEILGIDTTTGETIDVISLISDGIGITDFSFDNAGSLYVSGWYLNEKSTNRLTKWTKTNYTDSANYWNLDWEVETDWGNRDIALIDDRLFVFHRGGCPVDGSDIGNIQEYDPYTGEKVGAMRFASSVCVDSISIEGDHVLVTHSGDTTTRPTFNTEAEAYQFLCKLGEQDWWCDEQAE